MRPPIATAVLLATSWLPHAVQAQSPATPATSAVPATPAAPATSAASAKSASPASTASPASAPTTQVQGNPLDPVVVTAARVPQTLADTIPQTTVFTADEISKSGVADLPALLSQAPGAQMIRNGGPGTAASLLLRGGDADQTLVLVDGVRMESSSLGQAQLSQLMLDQIDHIEIVNGNVSALYGSNAVGGAVQIFTKDGGNHPPRFNFETELGSYHTQRQQLGVNGALDKDGATTFNITLARFKTDGFSAIDPNQAPGANPNANGFSTTSVGATLKHKINDNWTVGANLYESTGLVSFDSAFGVPTDNNVSDNHVRQMSIFADGKLTDFWTTHLQVGQGDDQSTTLLNGVENGRFNSRNQQFNWQNTLSIMNGQKFLFGYERLNQSLDSDEFTVPERHENSGFIGYDGRFGASQIQANLRRDQYSDYGGANSYFLGYGYNFSQNWKATFSYSDAFRVPTFDELYFPDFGNPNLTPERSHSVEAALQFSSENLGVARLSLFQTRYSDLITTFSPEPGVFLPGNVGQAKVQGLEGSWSGKIGATNLRASFTLQNPINQSTDTDLVRRARRFANLSANRMLGDWRVGAEWQVSGAREDSSQVLAGYGVVNLFARYNITKSWFVAARLDNLTNRNYELAATYNTPGRGAYVTVGWQQQ